MSPECWPTNSSSASSERLVRNQRLGDGKGPATCGTRPQTGKQLHLAKPNDIDIHALADMALEDAVASLGTEATADIMIALVNKRQELPMY